MTEYIIDEIGWVKSWSSDGAGTTCEILTTPSHRLSTDLTPYERREMARGCPPGGTIRISGFNGLANALKRYNSGQVKVSISIPCLSDCEIKQMENSKQIQAVKEELKRLAPVKDDIDRLQATLKRLEEDTNG